LVSLPESLSLIDINIYISNLNLYLISGAFDNPADDIFIFKLNEKSKLESNLEFKLSKFDSDLEIPILLIRAARISKLIKFKSVPKILSRPKPNISEQNYITFQIGTAAYYSLAINTK